MQSNYFHRQCNKTSRKFFEDFDLLPSKVKRILQESPTCPTFEDLKEAWKLAGEEFDLKDLMMQMNCFEEERKEKKKEEARKKREQLQLEKQRKWQNKYSKYQKQLVGYKVVNTRPKDVRLIERVTAEQAHDALCKRKENKDVRDVGVRVIPVYSNKPTQKPEKEIKFMEFDKIPNSLGKQMHNA